MDVLKDRVRSSLIPLRTLAHLRRNRNDELVFQQIGKLPTITQMLQQRLALELRKNVDRINPRIDEIAENEIDDTVFPRERDSRLRSLLGQGRETFTLATGEDDAENRNVLHKGDGRPNFSMSPPPVISVFRPCCVHVSFPISQHGDGTVGIESAAWLECSRETKLMLPVRSGASLAQRTRRPIITWWQKNADRKYWHRLFLNPA